MGDKYALTPSLSTSNITIGSACKSDSSSQKCIGGHYVSVIKSFTDINKNTNVCSTNDDNGMNIVFTVENSKCPENIVFLNTSNNSKQIKSMTIKELN